MERGKNKDDSISNHVVFTFEVTPTHEKLYQEKITLKDSTNENANVTITLHCRVLGKPQRAYALTRYELLSLHCYS